MECIHGLDDGQCDICFPKARPEQPVRTPTARTRSTRGSSSRSAPPLRSTPGVAIDVGKQRIYHLTHIDNLVGIFESGGLVAGAVPAVDISTPEVREARRGISVADDGATVASHVPFFLTPTADAWLSVREGTADPRIAVSEVSANEFVLLVSSIGAMARYVVADGDAAHPLSRFFSSDTDAASRTVRTLVSEGEPGRITAAEVLVPDLVPLDAIDLIAVANDRGRASVRTLTEAVEVRTRVAIHPPWFQREG